MNSIIRTWYYERVYQGDYYVVQHVTFKDVIEYFTEFREVVDYLNHSVITGDKITDYQVKQAIQKGIILQGYKVYRNKKG